MDIMRDYRAGGVRFGVAGRGRPGGHSVVAGKNKEQAFRDAIDDVIHNKLAPPAREQLGSLQAQMDAVARSRLGPCDDASAGAKSLESVSLTAEQLVAQRQAEVERLRLRAETKLRSDPRYAVQAESQESDGRAVHVVGSIESYRTAQAILAARAAESGQSPAQDADGPDSAVEVDDQVSEEQHDEFWEDDAVSSVSPDAVYQGESGHPAAAMVPAPSRPAEDRSTDEMKLAPVEASSGTSLDITD